MEKGVENMKLVSVVLPAYNAALFIGDAIESVLAQSYTNLEIIVIDDGSTDDTGKIVSRYNMVRYIRRPNQGAASARNRGIREAQGEYIAFIDADDLWMPEKITMQVDLLRQSGVKWCYCDSYYSWYNSEEIIGRLSSTQGVYQNDILVPYVSGKFSIPLPATLIRQGILEDIGYFDETLTVAEHTDLWARIAVRYPIGYLNQPLVQIRKRVNSLTTKTTAEVMGNNRRQMLNKLIALAPDRLGPLQKELMADSYVKEGKHFLRNGNISKARKCFGKAVQLDAHSIKPYFFWIACWVEPIPKLFYKLRWTLMRNRNANIRPGWWVKSE